MQYSRQQPSPTSSTSTIDQQEVIYDDRLSTPTTVVTTKTKLTNSSKSSPKKPRPRLYNISYKLTPWKSLNHHFLRYSDVKPRPEKRTTMSELSNELTQRNGWKAHYLTGQLNDLIQNESETRKRIQNLIDIFIQTAARLIIELANNCHNLPEQYAALLQNQRSYGKDEFDPSLIVSKLDDLLRGELQRNKMFDEQMRQIRDSVLRMTSENCERIPKITTKFNKRFQL
jgi:DNA anti-recombination protein RmuC